MKVRKSVAMMACKIPANSQVKYQEIDRHLYEMKTLSLFGVS
jgi:hypothetical protein